MIDFKAKVEELQMREGYCFITPSSHYAKTAAIRVNCITYDRKVVRLPFSVTESTYDGRLCVQFYGGVTGHERYYVKDVLKWGDSNEVALCAGTPGKYDKLLLINVGEFVEKIKAMIYKREDKI